MAKFRFKLEAVLRHRQLVEDQRQRELAQFLRERMILHHELRHMQQTIHQSKRDLGAGLVGAVDMDSVAHFARFSGQTTQRAHQIVAKLAVLERQCDAARARLLEATKARKALDLLRQRHIDLWRRDEERREAIFLDEVSVQSFARTHGAEVGS